MSSNGKVNTRQTIEVAIDVLKLKINKLEKYIRRASEDMCELKGQKEMLEEELKLLDSQK